MKGATITNSSKNSGIQSKYALLSQDT